LRKLHSDELHNLNSSPNIIRQIKSRNMRWTGHVASIGEERKLYKVLMGKPKQRRPFRRLKSRSEYGISMDLGEMAWGVWSGFEFAQDRGPVVGSCEYSDPLGSGAMS
jgi:hypothetical protein